MQDSWEALEQECAACRECALHQTRKNVVFGVGNPRAEIMLVGEGPGANEDATGIPFVGRAGQLLDDMLAIIGLDRDRVYICNIVKCRPPGNRDPLNVEQDACIGYLRRQMALIRPKILVCLGRIAAMRLIDDKFRITRDHAPPCCGTRAGGRKPLTTSRPSSGRSSGSAAGRSSPAPGWAEKPCRNI